MKVNEMKVFYKIIIFYILIFPLNSFSHEFWIELKENNLNKNYLVIARTGSDGIGELVRKKPEMVEYIKLFYENAKEIDLIGLDNSYIFGKFKKNNSNGGQIILKTRNFISNTSANEFNDYLQEEGLNNAIEFRKKFNLTDSPGNELFNRIAKYIFLNKNYKEYLKEFNLPLEITLVKEPVFDKIPQQIMVKLTKYGKPVKEKYIKAISMNATGRKTLKSKTDENGIAIFFIEFQCLWLFSSVDIEIIDNGSEQWKSTWSSLVLDLNIEK